MMIQQAYFGTIRGKTVTLYSITAGDLVIKIMNYGATLVSIETPDRNSRVQNIIAGFSSLRDYEKPHPYLGVIIGRYANRIASGRFQLDGKDYQLSINNHPNHLHGGDEGFHTKVWQTETMMTTIDQCVLSFSCLSPDQEEGYPGNLEVSVTYTVTSSELRITYHANTDKSTPINLTSHPYFNLSGFVNPTIEDHDLQINGEYFTEKSVDNVPTGRILPCERTPFDFQRRKKIGVHLKELKYDRGYDHNYVINGYGHGVRPVARLEHSSSGRVLEVLSDRPGLQLYTANWWDGSMVGVHGVNYGQHSAVALETQNFPDSPNHVNFPNAILKPGEPWHSQTIYRFSKPDSL